MFLLPHFHGTSFDSFTWRAGCLTYLGVQHNFVDINDKKRLLRRYATGYESAENLLCRPKKDYTAVLFCKEELEFWTHLNNDEFFYCFPEIRRWNKD